MTTSAPRRGDRGALSGPLAAVSFVAGLGGSIALAGGPPPRPDAEPAEVRTYFDDKARSARISAASQLVCTAALVRFTASVVRLAGRSGRGSRALQAAALAGGGLAAASLAASAAYTTKLTGSTEDTETDTVTLNRRLFAAGGPVHAAGFGLLTGALALAGLRTRELPTPVSVGGLVSAGAGLLSPLYFVAAKTAPLIPIGRFSGLVVSGIAGARLSR